MKKFEERLERLEELGEKIRQPNIPLDDALKAFEEGLKLAKDLEKDLAAIQSHIDMLMNSPEEAPPGKAPELELFGGP